MGALDDMPGDARSGVKFLVDDVSWVLPLTQEQTRQVASAGLLFKELTITVTLEEA